MGKKNKTKNNEKKNKVKEIILRGVKFPDNFQANQFLIVDTSDKIYRIVLPVPFVTFIMDTVHFIEEKLKREQLKKKIIVPGNPKPKKQVLFIPSNYQIKEKRNE